MAVAAGNPLALVELSAELAAAAGDPAADPARLPLSDRLERAFLRRVREQSRDVQRVLLLAAAEDSGDPGVLLAAAESLGVDRGALAAAEQAGLLRVDPARVDFAHPLVRSAVYQTAPFTERQDVHRALADVLAGEDDSGRRVWHRAAAAVFPAEDVVAELERAAEQARMRAGHEVAAAALERAAALTADVDRRARLLLDAAESAWESGAPDAASALVERAGRIVAGPLLRGRVDQLRGRIEARRGVVLDGYEILMDGAARIADLDPARAAAMLVDALQAASYGGDVARVVATGRRAQLLPGGADASPAVALVAGIGAALGGDLARAAPLLRSVIAQSDGVRRPAPARLGGDRRWLPRRRRNRPPVRHPRRDQGPGDRRAQHAGVRARGARDHRVPTPSGRGRGRRGRGSAGRTGDRPARLGRRPSGSAGRRRRDAR